MKKINITILYGSSCVGKSTIMGLKNSNFYKVEMDDSTFWEFDESMWSTYCLTYLSECISENTDRKDIIATCGGLPLPNNPKYSEIEKEHRVSFIHSLVLTRTTDDYIKNIAERGLTKKTEELIRDYNWRKSTINLYNNVIFNERGDDFAPMKEKG
jgi:hypothetical protein